MGEAIAASGLKMGEKPKFTSACLDQLIDDATVDAYDESEQAVGFFTMIAEHVAFPFTTQVLGQEVTVAKPAFLSSITASPRLTRSNGSLRCATRTASSAPFAAGWAR